MSTESVLRQELAPLHDALLKQIWEPAASTAVEGKASAWPTWDYVSRALYREHPEISDAYALLVALPSVPPRSANAPRYGLAWYDGLPAVAISPETRVGLTIAGLARVSTPTAVAVADQLARIIGELADAEDRLPLDPATVGKDDLQLSEILRRSVEEIGATSEVPPEAVVAAVLQHEYAPIQVYGMPDDYGNPGTQAFKVQLGRVSLRAFRGVRTAADYLDLVDTDAESHTTDELSISPLSLVQTLDFLGYVLSADPSWGERPRLTQAPDLQSAVALAAAVVSRSDYESALSGLWNVIGQLNVPAVPHEIAAERFQGKQPGSITQLAVWLEQRLSHDPAAMARARTAIKVIRAPGRLRAEQQHSSTSARAEAAQAHATLGLPSVLYDYASAWQTICARLADAFDTIRREVQAAAPPGAD